MVIVDTSGIHELPVVFCGCPNAPTRDIQLLRMGLYPATSRRPQTAFTIRLLDDHLLTNKECKIPALSYYSRLRRITSETFPHMVPDRYRDLLRVSRQWRNLRARRQAGIGYPGVPAPGPGAFAIKCPACPWPGINMRPGWETDDDRWAHAASIIIDGNFGAQHMRMKNPEDDVRLADGHGYMVTDDPYKDHLRTACKPKRQNMDYCVFQVTVFLHGIMLLLVLYDVWCYYYKHLLWQFNQSPALALPPDLTITGGIGQFHVHAHRAECYPRFSPVFIPGAGQQLIDSWDLDDHMNDSNWYKMTRLGERRGQWFA
ncbi:hypothetical protein K466DRAFT_579315 [Polyporus arcularius HHB13444]|uniref:CxC2-like cysteine cluster KDZ transposase-associated domain-containing protein n=1 Tax=Polyporus arcularius HHB13444 TaxID=1314778 RepID=A0A5C3NMR6_9APHY|nr:hypothetical protein K466DRAFT_579315 [Polyporus arcularius HHB13444]